LKSVLARAALAAVACTLALAACDAERNDLAPKVPASFGPALSKGVVYTAIGASDAVGVGASVPCSPQLVVATPTCPGGTGYVTLIATSLAKTQGTVTLLDLGISGAVIGPDIRATANLYGSQGTAAPCKPRTGADVVAADFLTDELPQVKGSETLVTIFAGGNDTNVLTNAAICLTLAGATQAQVQTFIATEIAAFGADLQQLLVAIRAKAPNAAIVIANLPNFANIPFAKSPAYASARPLLQAFSVGIDTNVYQPTATVGKIPTVDLLCDPRSYDPNNFFTDGFHPNDAAYTIFATLYLAQITAATPSLPQTNCAQMAILGTRDTGASLVPLANFERR